MSAKSVTNAEVPIVYLLEDDDDYRQAIAMVLTAHGYQVAEYRTANELMDSYAAEPTGCLILDLQTPGFDAIEVQKEVESRFGGHHPFILISAHGNVPKVAKAMRAGAVDFLQKPVDHQLLLQRVKEAVEMDRTRRLEWAVRKEFEDKLAKLTKRESQILSLVIQGLSSKQIGSRLDVGTNTVDVHRSNLMKKLEVVSAVELVRMLTELGIEIPAGA